MSKTLDQLLDDFELLTAGDFYDEDTRNEARQLFLQWVADEVVGDDMSLDHAKSLAKVRRDETNGTRFAHDADAVKRAEYQNLVRVEQRAILKQHGLKDLSE